MMSVDDVGAADSRTGLGNMCRQRVARLLDHQDSRAMGVARSGVERSVWSPMTMAGGDLLFFSQGHLGAVVRRRA
jgi:hypothetical protein